MGQLLTYLEKQLGTEYKQDAEDCLKIYKTLKDRTGGVWSSDWQTLVNTVFYGGGYPSKRRYKPTSTGEIFLKGLSLS